MKTANRIMISALALSLGPSFALAVDTPPEKPIGVTGLDESIVSVDLAPHKLVDAGTDYDLRARLLVVAPDGAMSMHPHAGRPGIARVVKGEVIEYRGSTSRHLVAGEVWAENADTVHWFRNPSKSVTAEIWVVDLFPKKKK